MTPTMTPTMTPEPQAPNLEKKLREFSQPEKRWDLWENYGCTTTDSISGINHDMAFSGYPDLAREFLEIFLASLPKNPMRSYSPFNPHLLAIWTHLPASKPSHLPSTWQSRPLHFRKASEEPDRDIFNPAFYTNLSKCRPSPRTPAAAGDPIDLDTLDPHSWSSSTNPHHVAACARALCRVPRGGVPTREAMEEAFEAMDRIWELLLPQERDAATGLLPLAYDEVFMTQIYLSFALGLGRRDKATLLFQRLADGWGLGYGRPSEEYNSFNECEELYELCLRDGGWLNLITREDAEACVELVKEVLTLAEDLPSDEAEESPEPIANVNKRKRRTSDFESSPAEPAATPPPPSPLPPAALQEFLDLGWPELLRRFSEAAFTVYQNKYRELPNPPTRAEEILRPPISPTALAEVEEKLGPLPADIREMVVVANGFRGLWHLFGGGFPGVDKFEIEPCGDSYLSFGVDEPSEEAQEAPIWIAFGGTEVSDDFNHIICPAETWQKLVGDDDCTAGEYRVTYTAHWDDGDEAHTSVREWIATETMQMEQKMATGSWEMDSGDEDDGDMEEEEDDDDE